MVELLYNALRKIPNVISKRLGQKFSYNDIEFGFDQTTQRFSYHLSLVIQKLFQ